MGKRKARSDEGTGCVLSVSNSWAFVAVGLSVCCEKARGLPKSHPAHIAKVNAGGLCTESFERTED